MGRNEEIDRRRRRAENSRKFLIISDHFKIV